MSSDARWLKIELEACQKNAEVLDRLRHKHLVRSLEAEKICNEVLEAGRSAVEALQQELAGWQGILMEILKALNNNPVEPTHPLSRGVQEMHREGMRAFNERDEAFNERDEARKELKETAHDLHSLADRVVHLGMAAGICKGDREYTLKEVLAVLDRLAANVPSKAPKATRCSAYPQDQTVCAVVTATCTRVSWMRMECEIDWPPKERALCTHFELLCERSGGGYASFG